MFCWFYRWKISDTFDGGGSLPDRCRCHLLRCDRCREFFKSSIALGERLSLEAALTCPDVPAQLRQRIALTVSSSNRKTPKPPFGIRRSVAAACVAAAVLMTALFVVTAHRRGGGSDVEVAPASAMLQSIFYTDEMTIDNLPESVGGFVERPLAGQLETITRQTESAVKFLIACTTVEMPGAGQVQ
jgi:hypothetical protein